MLLSGGFLCTNTKTTHITVPDHQENHIEHTAFLKRQLLGHSQACRENYTSLIPFCFSEAYGGCSAASSEEGARVDDVYRSLRIFFLILFFLSLVLDFPLYSALSHLLSPSWPCARVRLWDLLFKEADFNNEDTRKPPTTAFPSAGFHVIVQHSIGFLQHRGGLWGEGRNDAHDNISIRDRAMITISVYLPKRHTRRLGSGWGCLGSKVGELGGLCGARRREPWHT